MSFFKLPLGGKMALQALGGRPQPLKKPNQSQKGHFPQKNDGKNDTKTPELAKCAKETGNIFNRLLAVVDGWIKSKFPNATTGAKSTQMLLKNKALFKAN